MNFLLVTFVLEHYNTLLRPLYCNHHTRPTITDSNCFIMFFFTRVLKHQTFCFYLPLSFTGLYDPERPNLCWLRVKVDRFLLYVVEDALLSINFESGNSPWFSTYTNSLEKQIWRLIKVFRGSFRGSLKFSEGYFRKSPWFNKSHFFHI